MHALSRTLSPCAALWSTITRNKMLCIMCAILWALVPNMILAWLEPGYDNIGEKIGLTYASAVVFLFYMIFFIFPTGFICFCLCSCSSSGSCLSDLPYEALKAPAARDMGDAVTHMRELKQAEPVLHIKVECWHTVSSGSGKNRRTRRVTTYRATEPITIVRWKDISTDPEALASAVHTHGADSLAVSYVNTYELHPSQLPELERYKKYHYEANKNRDTACSATLEYSTAVFQPARIDNVVRTQSCRYQCSRIFVNYFWFYLSVWSTLYPLYITGWKMLQTPLYYRSVKYMHIIPLAPDNTSDA
jgi:hypothetical protein